MRDENSVVETITLLMEQRRKDAHSRLLAWSRDRERAGFPALSVFGKIVEDHVQGHTAQGFSKKVRLTSVESKADRLGETGDIERYVAMMPHEWKLVIKAIYILGSTMDQAAAYLSIDRRRVVCRLQDVKDRIAFEIEGRDVSRIMVSSRDLTQGPEDVNCAYRRDSVGDQKPAPAPKPKRSRVSKPEPIERYRKVNRDPLITLKSKPA